MGGTKSPDIARILDLKPDLVFANAEENRREDVEALREAGIEVDVTLPKTVAEVPGARSDSGAACSERATRRTMVAGRVEAELRRSPPSRRGPRSGTPTGSGRIPG